MDLDGDGEPCPVCGSEGDCHPGCPLARCPECGGVGRVIDLDHPVDLMRVEYPLFEQLGLKDRRWYYVKPCPRGCPAPSHA